MIDVTARLTNIQNEIDTAFKAAHEAADKATKLATEKDALARGVMALAAELAKIENDPVLALLGERHRNLIDLIDASRAELAAELDALQDAETEPDIQLGLAVLAVKSEAEAKAADEAKAKAAEEAQARKLADKEARKSRKAAFDATFDASMSAIAKVADERSRKAGKSGAGPEEKNELLTRAIHKELAHRGLAEEGDFWRPDAVKKVFDMVKAQRRENWEKKQAAPKVIEATVAQTAMAAAMIAAGVVAEPAPAVAQ